jgi:diguanylate cyclase (GGDEF)-like protein
VVSANLSNIAFLRADGGVCLLESRSGVIRDAAGRCKQVVVVAHDITERRLAEARIHHLAFHDPLTQLANRLTLMDRLQQGMAASKRSGCHGALLFLDLDNFKSVNDRHGHAAGDLLLIEAATRLSGCVRAVDTVARFGGDEFVVLLSELPAAAAEACAQARQVAEKIRHTLVQPYRLTIRQAGQADTGIEHQCTASIGVTLFMDHAASADDLLKWADAAMYQAKEAGRNRIAFHAALRPGRNPRQVSGRRRVNGEFDPPDNRWWREQATSTVVDALYARYPSLARRFGPGGRQACAADIQGHLDALDASVVTGQPGLFAEYAVWLKDVLASRGAREVIWPNPSNCSPDSSASICRRKTANAFARCCAPPATRCGKRDCRPGHSTPAYRLWRMPPATGRRRWAVARSWRRN